MLIATLVGFLIAMFLMAIGLLIGRPAIRRGCGDDCECLPGKKGGTAGELP